MKFKHQLLINVFVVGVLTHYAVTQAASLGEITAHQINRLLPIDSAGKYHVGWDVNTETSVITFNVVVETRGFIGFGISRGGGMTGADIVIGGVFDNGTSYFTDRHGVGNTEPVIDIKQDYELISTMENATHTSLEFRRILNTCDDQDVEISPDTVSLIWSYGETDVIQYHGSTNRGTYSANLLDPPMPEFDESAYEKWVMVANASMPAQKTTYWCSIHRSPVSYNATRHVIAFKTLLETPESLKHTHHFTMYKCTAPPGQDADELFGPLVGSNGGECYVPPEEQIIPVDLCRGMIYVWAVGGKMMIFPEDVGFPIIENGQTEYLMLEVHYDNPESLEGVEFESKIEIFNTPQLRPQEAAVLLVAHSITFSHVVPAQTQNYVTVGHCSSECTLNKLRPTGINLFNTMLHAHQAGRKLKLRHFRDRAELPWISVDDNYNFDFQQNRPLREFRNVLPGDHLTYECTQETMDRTGVTIASFGSTDEMCQGIIWYFPADELRFCESAYNEGKIMERFGIEDLEWTNILQPPIIKAPESMANKTYVELLNTMVEWNSTAIAELQQETRFNNHYQASCGFSPIEGKLNQWKKAKTLKDEEIIGYPELDQVYVPENPCL